MFSRAASSCSLRAFSSCSRCCSSLVLPGELGVELLALGDVLVRAEQAAVRHRPAHDGNEAPIVAARGPRMCSCGSAHKPPRTNSPGRHDHGCRWRRGPRRSGAGSCPASPARASARRFPHSGCWRTRSAARRRRGTCPATCCRWRHRSAHSARPARSSRCCRSAFCAIRRALSCSRSVMSCSVTTQPPSARGWIETDRTRPSPGRLTSWVADLPATRSRMLARTSSAVSPA